MNASDILPQCNETSVEGIVVADDCGPSHGLCNLMDIPCGIRARVTKILGCRGSRVRLCALGFTPGAEVTVCGQGAGGCRVALRGSCVVLDSGSAGKILCDGGVAICPRDVACSQASAV